MKIEIISCNDPKNKLNKTMNVLKTFNINLKDKADINNLSIIINNTNIPNDSFNMVSLEMKKTKYYYFVKSRTSFNKDLTKLELENDVLSTFNKQINNSTVIVKTESQSNYDNGSINYDVRPKIQIIKSDTDIPETNNIIMTTLGGGNIA